MQEELSSPRVMTGYISLAPRHGHYSRAVARHFRHHHSTCLGIYHTAIASAQAGLWLPESICSYTR